MLSQRAHNIQLVKFVVLQQQTLLIQVDSIRGFGGGSRVGLEVLFVGRCIELASEIQEKLVQSE